MEQEFKKQWVEALRSGNFKQGTGRLRQAKDDYCCLGVYCIVRGFVMSDDGSSIIDSEGTDVAYEPLNEEIGPSSVSVLYRMNDTFNYTFDKIADWIEQNL